MKDVKIIYLVLGRCGEYGDTREWFVRACEDKAAAERLIARLNAWCTEHHLDGEGTARVSWDGVAKPPEDPWFDCTYTGTQYRLDEVPFEPAA